MTLTFWITKKLFQYHFTGLGEQEKRIFVLQQLRMLRTIVIAVRKNPANGRKTVTFVTCTNPTFLFQCNSFSQKKKKKKKTTQWFIAIFKLQNLYTVSVHHTSNL